MASRLFKDIISHSNDLRNRVNLKSVLVKFCEGNDKNYFKNIFEKDVFASCLRSFVTLMIGGRKNFNPDFSVSNIMRNRHPCHINRFSSCLNFNHQTKMIMVRNSSYWMRKRIENLEKYANDNPNSASAQYSFLEAVVDIDPDYVMKRVECGKYVVDDRIRNIYMKANSKMNKTSFTPEKLGSNSNMTFEQISPMNILAKLWRSILFVVNFLIVLYIISFFFRGMDIKGGIDIGSIIGDKGGSFDEIKTEKITMRFSDVKGNSETKQELMEIVDFLKNPLKYQRIGGRISNGVLLVGPPGTGKTMLAKAIAGEAGVPFFYATGSEFDEVFVGVGASRIRKLFEKARKSAPCIVFIDELDAVGSKRRDSEINPYGRMTLNQLLTEMDGFKDKGVVVIGATNAGNVLDPALTRAGRFDAHINVPLPSYKDRVEILDYYLEKVTCSKDIKSDRLASLTPGASGADLSNLVNQAAIHAVNTKSKLVTMSHLEWARDKILMGRERKGVIFTEEEKQRIAYHEAGHAVVAYFTPGARKLHKATIIPRGSALGVTHLIPDRDEYLLSYQQLLANIDVCMGGRAAEELIYGKNQITTGCSSDLANATAVAKKMVSQVGYSDKIGLSYLDQVKSHTMASDLDNLLQDEIKLILDESYKRAFELLKSKAKQHRQLAEALCVHETLDDVQLKEILG